MRKATSTLFFVFVIAVHALAIPIIKQNELNAQMQDIVARDPSFGSFFRKIKKLATPANIGKVAGIAALALRDDTSDPYARDVADIDLAGRSPSTTHYFAQTANAVTRDDRPQLSPRAPNSEHLEDITAREPSFKSFFRKVKSYFTPNNIDKAADTVKTVSKFIKREDAGEYEDLAARDPSFKSFFRKVKSYFTPNNIDKAADIAKTAGKFIRREDSESELDARSGLGLGRSSMVIVTNLDDFDYDDLE